MSIAEMGERTAASQTPDPSPVVNHEKRAGRWKELCRNLTVGMPSVFASYELEIDGKATPTIESAGFYKCCVDFLVKIEDAPNGRTEPCPTCGTVARAENNNWRAA